MRMPILSYFLFAGAVLFGALILVSNQMEPMPLQVSQTLGVPAPFKATPEESQSKANAANFAAEYPVTNAQVRDAAPKPKRNSNPS
jgi:hypothetical protein